MNLSLKQSQHKFSPTQIMISITSITRI